MVRIPIVVSCKGTDFKLILSALIPMDFRYEENSINPLGDFTVMFKGNINENKLNDVRKVPGVINASKIFHEHTAPQ